MHLPKSTGARVLTVISALLLGLVGVGVVSVNKFSGNIHAFDITSKLGPRPTKAAAIANTDAMNILVMGSDARAGQGSGFGQVSKYGSSARSDTTLLVHLYSGHKRALAVSIPRDSFVTIPECTKEDGSTAGPWTTKFNAAFSMAGPACTVKTVEALTGLFIDHYVVVDFKGFEAIVDAIGGVSMCLTEAVQDSKSHLDLPAGTSVLDGKTALAFVRTRYSMGDGSDIARIRRQQGFISALVRKVKSSDVLLNPLKLYRLLDATTSSLTMDPTLAKVNELRSLAMSLRGISSNGLRFVTVPWQSDGSGNVLWTEKATELWDALKADQLWPKPGTLGFDGKVLTTAPADVDIDITNETTKYLPKITAALTSLGYVVHGTETSAARGTKTRITSGERGYESARTLATALGLKSVTLDPNEASSIVHLYIGKDWHDAAAVEVNPAFSDANSTSIYGPSSGVTAENATCTKV